MGHGLIQLFLRILTPEEIHQLTVISSGGARRSLTSMIEEQLFPTAIQAKPVLTVVNATANDEVQKKSDETLKTETDTQVLPFKQKVVPGPNTEQAQSGNVRETKVIVQGSTARFVDAEPEVIEEKIDTTMFILEEKKRSEKTQKVLKSLEVLQLYKKSSSVDLNQERMSNKDFSTANGNGLLINKKQS